MLKWKKLPTDIRNLLIHNKFVNGCGGQNGLKFSFLTPKEACAQHDLDYVLGGSSQDRLRADKQLLQDLDGFLIPYVCYLGVRVRGVDYFRFGEKINTLEELRRYLSAFY